MSRNIYLESTPLHEALSKWLQRLDSGLVLRPLSGERIKVIDSLGRVTAQAELITLLSEVRPSFLLRLSDVLLR